MLFALFLPIIISFTLGLILLFSKQQIGVSKRVLGTFFLLFSFALFAISLNFIRTFLEPIQKVFPYVEILFYPVMLSLPVVVFLYIRSLVYNKNESIGKEFFVHFFIPIQSLLFNIIPNLEGSISAELSKKLDFTNFFSLKVTFILMNIYYLVNSFIVFKQNSRKINDEYSFSIGIQFKWMTFFVFGYIAFLFCFFLLNPDASPFVVYIPFLMVTYYLFSQRYNQESVELQLEITPNDEERKENSGSLNKEKRTEIIEKLNTFIKNNDIYLQNDLTIHDVAKEIKVNSSYLSNVINQDLKTNFVTYINSFRIENAKEILLDEKYNNYTIEAISELVGFKSKSSFNNAFKNLVGMTPSEFKKKKL